MTTLGASFLLLPDAPPLLGSAEAVLTSFSGFLLVVLSIVSMAKRASPAARHANAGVDGLSAKTNEPRLPVGLILEFSFS